MFSQVKHPNMAPSKTTGKAQGHPTTSRFKPHRPTRPGGSAAPPAAEASSARAGTDDATPTIPSDLLSRLLHDFFEDERTRVSADANALVAKYMETFVKEALARATLERNQNSASSDKFLEVRNIQTWTVTLHVPSIYPLT